MAGGAAINPRRHELTDFEWSVIQPLLPKGPRGVARADGCKMLNGVYWRLCTGSPWAADILPQTMAIAACGHGKREPAGDLGENIGEGAYQANSLLEIIGVPGSTKVRTGLFILGGQPTVQPTATTRSSFHQLSEADFWAALRRWCRRVEICACMPRYGVVHHIQR